MTDTGNRVWTPVPGWEGLYEAHPDGHVRSLDRITGRPGFRRTSRGRVLSPVVKKATGRTQVTLSDRGRREARLVSQVIALTFLGPCPDGYYVAHKNDDPADNRVENLYYATPKENVRDAFTNGRRKVKRMCPHCGGLV